MNNVKIRHTHGIELKMLVAFHAVALVKNHRRFLNTLRRVETDASFTWPDVVVPRQLELLQTVQIFNNIIFYCFRLDVYAHAFMPSYSFS